jgi:hypothetical protein
VLLEAVFDLQVRQASEAAGVTVIDLRSFPVVGLAKPQ